MRYLKMYNIFENSNNNEIVHNIEDILLDLKDNSFNITVLSNVNYIRVNIFKDNGKYNYIPRIYPKIKDYLLRLKDYMYSESYHCFFDGGTFGYNYISMNKYEELLEKGKFDYSTSITIKFELKE